MPPPIAEADSKLSRFMFNGIRYESLGMPFGLAPAPRIATKFRQPVIRYLRHGGVGCTVYIRDIIIPIRSQEKSLKHTQLAVDVLHSLGLETGSVVPLANDTDGVWSVFFPVAKKGTEKPRGYH